MNARKVRARAYNLTRDKVAEGKIGGHGRLTHRKEPSSDGWNHIDVTESGGFGMLVTYGVSRWKVVDGQLVVQFEGRDVIETHTEPV